ncbi:YqhA family protein [Jeotgalibacillus marinus]|uniref:YqhA family protein n=1 Tax=Jeotgalibacillus marinus TaxID=86667 RepID=A0ABV3Q1K3_9BACL
MDNMFIFIFFLIAVALITIGVISFVLFIRRLLVNSHAKRNNHAKNIEELKHKLDRIIVLLEKERGN